MIKSAFSLNNLSSAALLALVALLSLPAGATAETIYWNGPTGSWNSTTNWTTDPAATTPNPVAVPGALDSVIFNRNSTNTAATIQLMGPQSASSITFRQTSTTTLQGGGTDSILTIGSGGILKMSGSGVATIGSATSGENVSVSLGASQTWTNSSSTALTINNGITGGTGAQTLTLDTGSGGISISGGIADGTGAVSLVKNGTGGLSLRSQSTYTGTTTLNAGSINSGGGSQNGTLSGVTGTGQLIINGGSISNNATGGNLNYHLTNTSQIWGGDFSLSTGSGTTLRLTLGQAATNSITLTGNRTVSTSGSSTNSSITINGAIGDGGNGYNMTWAGSSGNVRVNLAGGSTYTGTTTVLSSMLQFNTNVASGADSAFGNSTSAILLGDTTGSASAGIIANAGTFNFERDIILQSGGTGVLTIGSVTSSATGNASMINTGNITLGTGTTGRSVILHRGVFSGTIADPAGLVSSPGLVTITSQRATNGNSENSFSTVLSGNNTFTGGVLLTNNANGSGTATLVINSSTAIGTGTLTIESTVGNMAIDSTVAGGVTLTTNNQQVWNGNNTGTFTFTGTQNLDMGTGAVSLGSAAGTTRTVATLANTLSVGGTISDGSTAVNLTKTGAGALVLYGASSYSGVTTISAGTLQLGKGGATGSLATSGVVNNGTLVFNRSDTGLNFSAPISGTGGIIQAGTGRTTLSGTHTYSGATVINAGTFVVNGSIAAASAVALNNATLGGSGTIGGLVTTAGTGSIIAPGNSPGTLTLSGGLDASLGATFNLELGTSSDLLELGSGTFTGSLGDDGLVFNFANSGGLLAGTSYTLMNFGIASGLQYSDLFVGATPSGFVLDSTFGTNGFLIGSNSLQVQFSPIPEPSALLLIMAGSAAVVLIHRARRPRPRWV